MSTIRELNGPNDAAFEACMALYLRSFPLNEREPVQRFVHYFPGGTAASRAISHQLVSESAGSVEGYSYSQFLEPVGLGFVVYIAIAEPFRGQGLGSKLLEASISVLKADAARLGLTYAATMLEVERVEDADTDAEKLKRARRLRFFANAGAELLTSGYVQPALADGQSEVPLNLLWIPNSPGPTREEVIRAFYREVFGLDGTNELVKASLAGVVA